MKKILFFSILMMLFVFPAFAQEEAITEEGSALDIVANEVSEETKIDTVADIKEMENLPSTNFFADETVNVTGDYNNDVIAVGNNITIDAVVDGDVLAMGGTVTVKGKVTGNVRVAGGSVYIQGEVDKNVNIGGGSIYINDTASIGRDLILYGGMADVNGNVGSNIMGSSGSINVNSQVGDKVEVDVGTLTIGPNADINGEIKYTASEDATIDPSAQIGGTTTKLVPDDKSSGTANGDDQTKKESKNYGKTIGWKVVWWISYLLLGLLLIYAFPKCVKETSEIMFKEGGRSVLAGILFLILMPILCLILLVTVIGIPISILGFVAYGTGIYLAAIFLGIILGNKILPSQKKPLLPMLIGVTIIYLLKLIPFVGGLVSLIAAVWVLGAYIITLKNKHEEKKEIKKKK
ncbi:hypothetical protein KKF29_02155 [Patescibacteria group bacterium]|nr:hypothetical protein [Patescibacteria group bacterium]